MNIPSSSIEWTRFVHLSNIRTECAKLRTRLEESKREVLSRRSSTEQIQLTSVLDAMIAVCFIAKIHRYFSFSFRTNRLKFIWVY